MNNENIHREIKSYVLRQGKITPGQKNALEQFFSLYGIEYQNSLVNLSTLFARENKKIIEIGFGMGHATWQIAKNNPDTDYLGIEVHLPGVGALLMQIEEHAVKNLRIIRHDAVEVIRDMIPDNSIHGFHIFFLYLWHKKRHHKRRIIQEQFVELLSQKLESGGYIHLATDWEDYALWMLKILEQQKSLVNTSPTKNYITRPDYRPLTKFENRGINLGHGVWDLVFKKL